MKEPIRHLVVLGHPAPRSFNRAVAEAYCASVSQCGQQVALRDLYGNGFDPLLKDPERQSCKGASPDTDLARDLTLLRACDVITLVYPIWFGMPPAIIKGYVDRVMGAEFSSRDLMHEPLRVPLKGKHLRLLTSSATTRPWLEEHGQWVALRQAFDRYLATVFSLGSHDHMHFDAIVDDLSPLYFEECLETTRGKAREWCAHLAAEQRRNPVVHQASWPAEEGHAQSLGH